MKKLTVPVLLFIIVHSSIAQQASVKGVVRDTSENKNLTNAVISILRKSDSSLVRFSRSDKNGFFQIENLPSDSIVIMVTYPKFADFVDEVVLTPNELIDMGPVMMTPRSVLLQEVVVRHNLSIRLKGDTVEFKADSFHVQEGANVQELLKKMPGIQVDRNGQITAQGQKVEKVLVDGEEFFSDDPAVVTKNLRADAVDKVQAYDKKSDQAAFTGIDDGSKTKTLNLVLKDDKKKGYFGKISAGGGTHERYENDAMLNYFKGKKKASVYGIMSNTGKLGLDWQDRDKFGGGEDWGDGDMEVGAGFIFFSGDNSNSEFDDYENSYNGEGVPQSWKAGAHFSNKWAKDLNHLNGNFSAKQLINTADGSSLTKYVLPDSAYYFREHHVAATSQMQEILTSYYDVKFDSLSSIRFRFNAAGSRVRDAQLIESGSDNEELLPVNRNTRRYNTTVDQQAYFGSVLWKQRLKKKGRTLSLSASHKYVERDVDGFLNSHTEFYDASQQITSRDSIDQYKTSFSRTLTTNGRLIYTEPLGKKSLFELNYTINRIASSADRRSFDKQNGKYEALNPILSNSYQLLYLLNSAGGKYQYNGKKLTATLGTNVGVSAYSQKDSLGKEVRNYNYTNVFPNARLGYRIAAQSSINFTYTGNNQPPTIDQIQPIHENTDPLNIVIGNPLLKQAFQHNFTVFYNNFKVLTGRSIWANYSYNFTTNAIVSSQVTDSAGRRTLQYVNTDGNYNSFAYLSYGFKLKKISVNIDLHWRAMLNRYTGFVNNLENTNNNRQVEFGIGFYKDKEEKYSTYINSSISFNRSASTITTRINSYRTQSYDAGVNVFIKKKIEIGSDLNMNFREKVDAFDRNNDVISWNASLTYKFFKNRNGLLKFAAYDLLDQRKGFDRSFTSNYITEKNYQVLQRYFMLSFTWNFTRNPGGAPAPSK